MTREEAIEELERMLAHWNDLENGKRNFRWYSKDAVGLALSALRPVSREQVEKTWRGEWKNFKPLIECQICGEIYNRYGENEGKPFDFCPACGAPMTDEAVQMVMERFWQSFS